MIDLALQLEAGRLEIAHVQYYGWALQNRARADADTGPVEAATRIVEGTRSAWPGGWSSTMCVPDYFARRPKACMGGWGRRFMNIAPDGSVLPCHAAETITGYGFR